MYGGLNAKVRTIWIPSRQQSVIQRKRGAQDVEFLLDICKDQLLLTNNLEHEETLSFIGFDKSDSKCQIAKNEGHSVSANIPVFAHVAPLTTSKQINQ